MYVWEQWRLELLKKPAFVKKALRNIAKTEPDLVELFRSIPRQIKLSKEWQDYVVEELKLHAIERELYRTGMSQYGPTNAIAMVLKAKRKSFVISMMKEGNKWSMIIREQVEA